MVKHPVGVEKVTELVLARAATASYKQTRVKRCCRQSPISEASCV
jgi:hypothetical protein